MLHILMTIVIMHCHSQDAKLDTMELIDAQ